jgi:hypothetical protein
MMSRKAYKINFMKMKTRDYFKCQRVPQSVWMLISFEISRIEELKNGSKCLWICDAPRY